MYLSGTIDLSLFYPVSPTFDTQKLTMQVDRKSNSGACEFFGQSLVAWHSKK